MKICEIREAVIGPDGSIKGYRRIGFGVFNSGKMVAGIFGTFEDALEWLEEYEDAYKVQSKGEEQSSQESLEKQGADREPEVSHMDFGR